MEEEFTKNMVKRSSFQGRERDYKMALDEDLRKEPSPYAPATLISKGNFQSAAGGVTELLSTEGGTILFTVDPDTGVVTIGGPVVASVTLTVGTINNGVIAGQTSLAGTLTNNRLIQAGTYNSGTFGTPAIAGGSWIGGFIGTPVITGGTFTSMVGTLINGLIGTSQITGGTINPASLQVNGTAGIGTTIVYAKNVVPGDLGTLVFTGGLLTSSTG